MIDPDILDAELLRFIDEVVDSVELLEVLALVAVAPPQWFDATALTTKLQTTPGSASPRLQRLYRAGVVERCDGHYRYAPKVRGPVVERLLRVYATDRVRVVDAIFSRG